MRTNPELAGVRSWIVLAAISCVVFALTASRAQFLNFDDNLFFGGGDTVFAKTYETGDLSGIVRPGALIANAYLPVAHLSLYLDYLAVRALGAGPSWPHWHSLLIHVLAAWALARLLGRLGLARIAATGAAALFLVHPALVESVAWVSSRKDVLSGLFAFACLSAVVDHARGHGKARWLWAAGFAVLALYSKGTAVVLLLLAPLAAWVAGGRWLRAGPLVVGALAVLAGLHHAGIAAAEGTLQGGDLAARLARVPGVLAHYATRVAWPAELNVLYPEVQTLESFTAQAALGVGILVAILALAGLAWWRGRRMVAGGLLMGLAALTPFNTAWPASSIAAADRYLYLVVPWCALAWVAAFPERWRLASLVIALPLGWVAFERARDFESSEALWTASLEQNDDNAVARINLAVELQASDPERARGLVEGAVRSARYAQHRFRAEEFLRELAVAEGRLEDAAGHASAACLAAAELPESAEALGVRTLAELRLATLMLAIEKPKGARAALMRAKELAPDDPGVLAYEASLLLVEASDEYGQVAADAPEAGEAIAILERALRTSPRHFEVNLARARWAVARGELMMAIKHLGRAREADPTRVESYQTEADLFLSVGDFAAAETAARAAIAAKIDDPNILVRLGLAMTGQGELAAARDYYRAYLDMRPDDVAVQRSLAAVYAAEASRELYQMGPDTLDAAAQRVADLDPDNGNVWLFRGLARRLRADIAGALLCLERAREALPASDDVVRLLAETHRDRGYELLREAPPPLEENPPLEALQHFRTFVSMAVPGLDTFSAQSILQVHWEHAERRGVDAFTAGEFANAEREFRLCLELVPQETSAVFQLGLSILRQGDERSAEALRCFERAERGQRERGNDVSLAVLYQVLTLQQLGRSDEARDRATEFLAGVGEQESDVHDRIREAIRGD